MKDLKAVFEALDETIPWGDALHGLKSGKLEPSQIRLLADTVAGLPDNNSARIDVPHLKRLVALMSVCFHAKANRYPAGTDGSSALEALFGQLATAIVDG